MNLKQIQDLFDRWFEDNEVVVLESGTTGQTQIRVYKVLGPFESWFIDNITLGNLAKTLGVNQVQFSEEKKYLLFTFQNKKYDPSV